MFGTTHRFIGHDKIHPNLEKIYMMLSFIAGEMKLNVEHEIQRTPCMM